MKKLTLVLLVAVVMAPVNAGITNLLTNPSFENGSSGWSIVNWNGATSTISDDYASNGEYSMKTVHNRYSINYYGGSWTSIGQNMSGVILADTEYQITFDYLTQCSDGFSFRFGDPSQVMHSSGVIGVDPITDGQWHNATSTFSRTAGELSYEPVLAFYYDYNVNMGTIYLDNITLTEVPEPCSLVLLGLGGLVLRRRRK